MLLVSQLPFSLFHFQRVPDHFSENSLPLPARHNWGGIHRETTFLICSTPSQIFLGLENRLKFVGNDFYSTPFWGRVYKWKFCLSVHLSVITSYFQTLSSFNRYLSNGRSNRKNKKNKVHFCFEFCFREVPPHPVNWSPTHSTGPQKLFLQISQYRSLK